MQGIDGAQSYDRWFDEPWGRFAFSIESRALLDALGPINERRLLDAGCGSGRFTETLANHGASVVGLDREPALLALAHARVQAQMMLGDARALPFSDEHFDAAVAVTVCEFTAEPGLVVAELARVTRQGGRVVLGALNPRSAWGLAHRKRFHQPPWTAARFLSVGELEALGARHGTVHVKSALYAPGAFLGLTVFGVKLEALRFIAPSLGAFRVVLITRR